MKDFLEITAMVASTSMPLFNIPLIMRIIHRKSSDDLSLIWVFGVYACILAMFPYSLMQKDLVLKLFSISNTILFTGVVVATLWFRIKK